MLRQRRPPVLVRHLRPFNRYRISGSHVPNLFSASGGSRWNSQRMPAVRGVTVWQVEDARLW